MIVSGRVTESPFVRKVRRSRREPEDPALPPPSLGRGSPTGLLDPDSDGGPPSERFLLLRPEDPIVTDLSCRRGVFSLKEL